ncbi:MAG: hypothetical protein R2780_05835 [Crocinitomicaceae bacterium]
MDNDNDKDVFVSPIGWMLSMFLRILGAFNFGTPVLVTNHDNYILYLLAILTMMVMTDIIAGTDDLYYIENAGVFKSFDYKSERIILCVVGIDVDGDSDLDIVASDHSNDKFIGMKIMEEQFLVPPT